MNELDASRKHMVDEIILISKRFGWTAEYIETVPRLDRVHAMEIIQKIIEDEENQNQQNKKMIKNSR